MQKAIFAGGCFWCTEAVFLKIEGVQKVISGYTGGKIKNPCYREVAMGLTSHAEAIQIEFDESKVTYEKLLEIFFATHDPTTLNRQGNDVGTQYRSEIFYTDENQKNIAESFIQWLTEENIFSKSIVTKISPAMPFYEAEDYHQNYYNLNSSQPYCQIIIDPKIAKLEKYYAAQLKKAQ
ncbi:peptide-methionine (S)-S-oxide reductase [Pustulibacterium marinum]|uniref:Peptide methionine sulfoxide reductase MsrA n=1 Tax=Pustulibacterium marinum TaxID=1224947 RepID=A0A1I7ID67_9FLAO|nr:peptide-methionine (S)-S-oxide reductase MsrA [Pustulibacterium marinum]SFU70884.1 peptide-methionine (S)-S-oxide reductase [Pustulibacterium marinum]